jgi:hypothetical protein
MKHCIQLRLILHMEFIWLAAIVLFVNRAAFRIQILDILYSENTIEYLIEGNLDAPRGSQPHKSRCIASLRKRKNHY